MWAQAQDGPRPTQHPSQALGYPYVPSGPHARLTPHPWGTWRRWLAAQSFGMVSAAARGPDVGPPPCWCSGGLAQV